MALKLKDLSDDELITSGENRSDLDTFNHRLTREMMRRLKTTIKDFNQNSNIQSKKMITLTIWIKWLTITLGILAIVQVILLILK